ncbi:recombinase family protein [Salinibacterium sp. NYA9b]
MRSVIYCRISQDRDGDSLGVERQEAECRALAERLGHEIDHVYVDNDISATNGKVRPEFEAMLNARPESIIAWHQDRLLRLTSDLEKVISLNVPVYTVTAGTLDLSTPAGRAVARTVAAWSTYEGEQKAVRQKSANVQRAAAGVWQFSRRPYGYERVNGEVVIVPDEAEIVREGYRRYLDGETYYALAKDWTEREVPGSWSMARVRSMLRNPAYAGERHYKGEYAGEGNWEPVIDKATWSAYVRMRSRRKRAGDWSTATKHLLSGIAKCGVCGNNLTARADRSYMSLACTANWCTSRKMEHVEDFVVEVLLARLADPQVVAGLSTTPDSAPLEEELTTLRERRDDLAALLADGLLSRDVVREKAEDMTHRIKVLEARLDFMRTASPLTDLVLAESVPARWEALPLPMKRRVLSELMVVTVNRAPSGRHAFDPSTVNIEWVSRN